MEEISIFTMQKKRQAKHKIVHYQYVHKARHRYFIQPTNLLQLVTSRTLVLKHLMCN